MIMGWTDNGKIMPPWITLSEQKESEGGQGAKGCRYSRQAKWRKKRLFKRFLKCSVRGGDAEEGGEEAVRR